MVIHSPIDSVRPVNNSIDKTATLALTAVTPAIVAGSIVAIGIAELQVIEAEIADETLPEIAHQAGIQLAQAIDLATQAREIAAVEIELAVAM